MRTGGRRRIVGLAFVAITALCLSSPANAQVQVFEDDRDGWTARVGTVHESDWDDVSVDPGQFETIAPDRYAALPAGPQLSADPQSGLFVFEPDGSQCWDMFPVSEPNVFSLDDYCGPGGYPTGILTVTFDTPIRSLGAWFLDVENGYAQAGIEVHGVLRSFSGNQGNQSQAFLGIASAIPFDTVNIYMTPDEPWWDSIMIDDILYGLIVGDMDCDGAVSAFDIDPFVLAMTDPDAYEAAFPDCSIINADCNADCAVDAFDIDPFVRILVGG